MWMCLVAWRKFFIADIINSEQGYKFAMYIVLPQKVGGLDELLGKIDSSTLHRAQYLLEEVEVKVALPKFKFSNSINLNDVLKDVSHDPTFIRISWFSYLNDINIYIFSYFSWASAKCSPIRHRSHCWLAVLPSKIVFKYRTSCRRLA